jgi:hypothetical protein
VALRDRVVTVTAGDPLGAADRGLVERFAASLLMWGRDRDEGTRAVVFLGPDGTEIGRYTEADGLKW